MIQTAIELTPEQQEILDADPQPLVVDPRTRATFVLVREEMFAKLKALLVHEDSQETVEAFYRASMEVFGREGWNQPEMDIYDSLDPRRK